MKISRVYLILTAIMLSVSTIGFSQQERVITKVPWKKEPIKFVKLQTKNRSIELGKQFVEGEDWLRGLTVTVENISNKPISRIVLSLFFPRPKGTSEKIPTYTVGMMYGRDPADGDMTQKQILVNEKVDVKLLEVNLPLIKTDLENFGYPEKITHVQIMVQSVTFDDGTMWSGDNIFLPQPDNPKQKMLLPLPAVETTKPPESSAVFCDRTTFFQDPNYRSLLNLSFLNYNFPLNEYSPGEELSELSCNTRYLGSLNPDCSTPGSGCTRLQNLFDDSMHVLGFRNARKQLGGTRCRRDDGTFCTSTPISNFDPLPCNERVAGTCNASADYESFPSTGCAFGFVNSGGICTRGLSFMNQCNRFGGYDPDSCGCFGGCDPSNGAGCSPVVVDVQGNGFAMTSAENGVMFDLQGNGTPRQFSWIAADSDDSWLALDRNNNGTIDSGRELFGNVTSQPPPPDGEEMNGFLALAQYDTAAFGGNSDGKINQQDAIFSRLKLWQDENHNGSSESCEMKTLPEVGLRKIDLDYRTSRRTDEFGNQFRYKAKVRDAQDAQLGRWAWDVFLVLQH